MSNLPIKFLFATIFCSLVPAMGQSADGPAVAGKALVEEVCTACHRVRNIERSSGYTEHDWQLLIATMIDLNGSDELKAITAYLAKTYPPNDKRQAKAVPGKAKIKFKEWVVPTLGQRSRDPIEAPDGMIWWAGQWASLIGRIDPRTGDMKEWPLEADAKPHSVFHDHQGNIWYTGNKNGTLGSFDPKSEKITVFKMPDPEAKDPHTAVVGRDGNIWFTMQHSNRVGRLDPKTGDVKIIVLPTQGSRPYGIKLDEEGAVWVACNGSNRIVRIDPKTMQPFEYEIPDSKTRIRRLDIAEDGQIWYVNSSRGRLGRLDPETGEVKEWPSPSGPKSHPYAIAIVNDIVWYNESGVRPDMLVRFDPRSENFQSWPIPSGGIYAGILRHLDVTRDSNLVIHQSATNRIIHVTLPPAD
ncbi:MAG: Vgb family protein [Hyphomicrobiaceae bacterium]